MKRNEDESSVRRDRTQLAKSGHNDSEVTKIYAHLTPSSLAPVVEDLDFDF